MNHPLKHGMRLVTGIVGGLTLAIVLPTVAQEGHAPEKAPAVIEGQVLTLADGLRIACDKQPALFAARASLAAAQSGQQALEQIKGPAALTVHDLAIRREQACIGVAIAEAALHQAEIDNAHAVSRLYFTAQYARTQHQVADDVVESFAFYQKTVSDAVNGPKAPKEWTTSTVDKLTVYLQLAKARRTEAVQGVERAVAALKEALGVCGDIRLAEEPLPQPDTRVNKAEIVAMARALRGEVVQTARAVEVYNLEICAQAKHLLPGTVYTFAAGSDIHAHSVPAGSNDGDYRPAAIGPEMPVILAGSKASRMQRAGDFANRAGAVAQKTENLIVLEAEDAFLRWQGAAQRARDLREAADAGTRLAKSTRDDFRGGQQVKVDEVLANEVLAAQARSSFNEALLNQLSALAALERVTGGGFCANLSGKAGKR